MKHLTLLDQFYYTNGLCDAFALAAQEVVGGRICIVWAKDERQFEAHDYPMSEPLCLHAFVEREDGMVVDAEGVRPLTKLLRAYGVRRGYDYELVRDTDGTLIRKEFNCNPEQVARAASLLRENGWDKGVPEVNDALPKNYKSTCKLARKEFERGAVRVVPNKNKGAMEEVVLPLPPEGQTPPHEETAMGGL